MKKENKYTIEQILKYLRDRDILLVNAEELGSVDLTDCLIDVAFIYSDDENNEIIN